MSHVALVALLAVAQGQYVRSRVNDSSATSPCLWWKEGTEIVYRQHQAGNAEIADDKEFTEVKEAFDTWDAELAKCSSLRLTEGARTATTDVAYDSAQSNENVVVFRTRRCATAAPASASCWQAVAGCANEFQCWDHSATAIGVTTTFYSPSTGQLYDGDIELNAAPNANGSRFIFTVVNGPVCPTGTGNQNCVATDLQNTMTHEVGHLLGLAHSPSRTSTMSAEAVPGETSKRTLDADSIRFLCDVYPKGGFTKQCVLKKADSQLGVTARGCAIVGAPASALALVISVLARRRRKGQG